MHDTLLWILEHLNSNVLSLSLCLWPFFLLLWRQMGEDDREKMTIYFNRVDCN